MTYKMYPWIIPEFFDIGFDVLNNYMFQVLPEEDVNVFAVFQHAHLLATGITTHHTRNGTELKPFAHDEHYDFNFQDVRILRPERKLMKVRFQISTSYFVFFLTSFFSLIPPNCTFLVRISYFLSVYHIFLRCSDVKPFTYSLLLELISM